MTANATNHRPPGTDPGPRLSAPIYRIRVMFGLMTALLIAVNDASCHGQPGAHPFLMLAGFAYPHLGQVILGRRDPDLRHGHALFLLDGLYAGAVIGAIEFSWLPSLALFVICLFNWMTIGGARMTVLGLTLLFVGASLSGNMSMPSANGMAASCNATLLLAACLFAGYFLIVARVIHTLIGSLQRQQAELQTRVDAANAARSLAERALLSAFPPSVAHQMEATGSHSPEILQTADLLLIEITGLDRPSADITPFRMTWQVCETILTRHGVELIKTCGNRGIALGRNDAGPKALVAAAKEILTYYSDHGAPSMVENGRPQRILIHRGSVTLGLVQPQRLDLDLFGPGMEGLLALATQTAQRAPSGLIVSPVAFRHLLDGDGFVPLPDDTGAPLCYLLRSGIAS